MNANVCITALLIVGILCLVTAVVGRINGWF